MLWQTVPLWSEAPFFFLSNMIIKKKMPLLLISGAVFQNGSRMEPFLAPPFFSVVLLWRNGSHFEKDSLFQVSTVSTFFFYQVKQLFRRALTAPLGSYKISFLKGVVSNLFLENGSLFRGGASFYLRCIQRVAIVIGCMIDLNSHSWGLLGPQRDASVISLRSVCMKMSVLLLFIH